MDPGFSRLVGKYYISGDNNIVVGGKFSSDGICMVRHTCIAVVMWQGFNKYITVLEENL